MCVCVCMCVCRSLSGVSPGCVCPVCVCVLWVCVRGSLSGRPVCVCVCLYAGVLVEVLGVCVLGVWVYECVLGVYVRES